MRRETANCGRFRGCLLSDTALETDDELVAIAPTARAVCAIVRRVTRSRGPVTRILTTASAANTAVDDFITELYLAAARDTSQLTVYATDDDAITAALRETLPVLVADDHVRVLIPTPDRQSAWTVTQADAATADSIRQQYDPVFQSATPVATDLPGPDDLYGTLADHLSRAFCDDLETIVETVDHLGGADDPLNVGLVYVLLGGRHQCNLRTLSHAAEDAGLFARSTVHRRKRKLVDAGLLEYEKVPADGGQGGRNRHQLKVADDDLADVPVEQLVATLRDHAQNL